MKFYNKNICFNENYLEMESFFFENCKNILKNKENEINF